MYQEEDYSDGELRIYGDELILDNTAFTQLTKIMIQYSRIMKRIIFPITNKNTSTVAAPDTYTNEIEVDGILTTQHYCLKL